MGKETELWDDSALINAFDSAMTKYKIMHGKQYHDSSAEGEKIISGDTENVPALIDENDEATRHMGADNHNNVVFNSATGVEEANDLPPFQENHHAGSSAPEPYMHTSNGPHMQEALEGYSNSQGVVEYTQLLNRYYELEEQRQKVLQQLHQVNSWNYQCSGESSGSCVQWGNCCSTSQEHQNPTHQASLPAAISSCCPYVCHCLVTSSPSMPACALGGACVNKISTDSAATAHTKGPAKLSPLVDDSVVTTAMGAAERAISSMKIKASSTNIHEGLSEGEMAQSISSETDLTVVLNAWYSAGFYTAKYLLEQSNAKGQRG